MDFQFDWSSRDVVVPEALHKAALASILALALDILQYFVGSAIWGIYGNVQDRRNRPVDEEFAAPSPINWPANFFFWLKAVAILWAYVLVLNYLWKMIEKA